jgi:hypothetical protein
MKKKKVLKLEPGLYEIEWTDGGFTLAAIGHTGRKGGKWIAPIDWVQPATNQDVWSIVENVRMIK